MKEKWVVTAKKADFKAIGEHFGIDQVIARVIRNRDLTDLDQMEKYLHGDIRALYSPHLLKDVDLGAEIVIKKVQQGKKIRIIGDYDIDGIQATYILLQGMKRVGAVVDTVIPDRILDGYGLNENLVKAAYEEGVDTIVTCDNGISAIEQIRLAKSLGMTVVVTDHHDVPFDEVDGQKQQILCPADAIINPKQDACSYPFKGLCGAAVAYKFVQVLYETAGIDPAEANIFIENAGFATIGDVMDLQDENRILVKLGLEQLRHTQNLGMRALIMQNGLRPEDIKAYHVGFKIGPCLNASGRLETARLSLKLLDCQEPARAAVMAQEIVELNESRKLLTAEAVEQAKAVVEEHHYDRDKVIVVYLPECHESLAGIVAGRIREAYHRPTFIVTRSEEGAKGSARSIEGYDMHEEMTRSKSLFTKFGGHKMAAGFSLEEEKIDLMRATLNAQASLNDEDLQPKIKIDVPMPVDYVYEDLVRQLELLEPFGKGNEKPVFADKNLILRSLKVMGAERRVIRMSLQTAQGRVMDAIYFGDAGQMEEDIAQKYGQNTAKMAMNGRLMQPITISVLYYPDIDTYYGQPKLQLKIQGYRF